MGGGYRRALPVVFAVYILAVAAGFLYFNMRLTIEWVAIVLFVAAILSGRGLLFLRDWGVFIAVLLAWQVASPLATRMNFPWHVTPMIGADRWLFFGNVPSVWLQQHLYHPGVTEPWDLLSAVMYMLHFLAPLLAGFLLWYADRRMFRAFALTFVLVALAGFATYILYPAVPPWMAAEPLRQVGNHYVVWRGTGPTPSGYQVYLPGVENLFNDIMGHWYNPYHGTIFFAGLHLSYDQVAAMPSEHAMYPMLFFLFLRRQFGRIAYLALGYIALLLFSITYMGQHYVADAVIGFAYAILGYNLVMNIIPWALRLARGAREPARLPVSVQSFEEA